MRRKMKFIIAMIPILFLSGCFKKEDATTNNKHTHTFDSYSYDKDYHYHVCKDCNGIVDKEEHQYDEGVVSKEATLDAEGEKTFKCSICGYEYTSSIPKLKESYTLRFLDWNGDLLEETTVKCGEDAFVTADPQYEGMEFKCWDKDITNVKSDMDVYAIYGWAVDFYDYDGTLYNSQVVCNGESAVMPEAPKRSGYRFDKWDKSLNNIVRKTEINAEYIKQYKVSFLNYDGSVYQTVYVDEGDSMVPIDGPKRTGYTFVGWEGSLEDIYANVSITPKYEIKVCKVDFKIGYNLVETQYVSYGQSATEPASIYVDWKAKHCFKIESWKTDYSQITQDTTIQAKDYHVITDKPVIYVDTTEIEKGKEYATVKVYIFGPVEKVCGINMKLSFNSDLIINNDLVTLNTNFTVGNNAVAGYNVDTKNNQITFSWIEGNGKTIAADTYVNVLTLKFAIDTKLQEGTYDVLVENDITKTYFVTINEDDKDNPYVNNPILPEIISGGIKIY